MSKNITLEYYGMPGTGPTIKEAKADAARKLSRMVANVARGPQMLILSGFPVLVWPDTDGWRYRIFFDGVKAMRIYGASGEGSECDAIRRAASHAAQVAWTHDVADDGAFAERAAQEIGSAVLGTEQRGFIRDLVSYFGWQRGYRTLHDRGLSDSECHAGAYSAAWNAPRIAAVAEG